MIFPTKNLTPENSILGIGSIVLKHFDEQETISSLWEKVRHLPEINSFEKFVLALDFLYTLGLVDFNTNEMLEIHHAN